MDVVATDPRVEICVAYDGLTGLSQRSILRDIWDELVAKGPTEFQKLVEALKRHGGIVTVTYLDYVSYGIGGGDATAENTWPHTMLIWCEPARPAEGIPAHVALRRNPPVVPALELPTVERQVERMTLG
ncbi:MAG TPA: hypothetical protein VMG14_01405 [Thermoplasmata archaeon]|nr:hypothetical protein [Thermoplasmata archaeon]HTW76409.1 hypothetical protein [Thermoplasmata archaeon]